MPVHIFLALAIINNLLDSVCSQKYLDSKLEFLSLSLSNEGTTLAGAKHNLLLDPV